MNQSSTDAVNRILVIRGQGIGPECITAAQTVLAATEVPIIYTDGILGYPDARELFTHLRALRPEAYAAQFGSSDASIAADKIEKESKDEARAGGNIGDFYKKILAKLKPEVRAAIRSMITDFERQTLEEAARSSAVLKGALRTLDEGDEPSRNVTIRKAFEQYANIRRCVTLDPIAPGMKGADILFVRENVEDLYASIEHRLGRNYPQALRHQTPEGCEVICRAAFEAALRDGRRTVTALEKPNILKITGGLFKDTFLKVAKDYGPLMLGERAIASKFMIIDDGLAAIAATPENFDVVVTSNMFGDIGSDVAAKVTGGVGLVSSNNVNPNNPRAVSMFETMGGTADDIAGQDKANPVALIDAAAEMLLHIGGRDNIEAAELMKTAILETLAEGYYVGDIRRGPYQEQKGREKIGTQAFARRVAEHVRDLKAIKNSHPAKTIKQIAMDRADSDVKPLFSRVLRSYEQFAADMRAGEVRWVEHVRRNQPPNPVRSRSRVVGFDIFVDDAGMDTAFTHDGAVDISASHVATPVYRRFLQATGIDLNDLFHQGLAGSLQSLRSFGQYAARTLRTLIIARPEGSRLRLQELLEQAGLTGDFSSRFAEPFMKLKAGDAVVALEAFDRQSIILIQAFYIERARVVDAIVRQHGFKLVRITSRGTEIYPTMCDFEKREVDRFRIEIDHNSPLASHGDDLKIVQTAMMMAQVDLVKLGFVISETMLNRNFIDAEGAQRGREITGVSLPYAKDLGRNYAQSQELGLGR